MAETLRSLSSMGSTGGRVRGAGWRVGVLLGLLGLAGVDARNAAGALWQQGEAAPAVGVLTGPLPMRQRGSGGNEAAEPPRARAARRFLARRGMGLGSKRLRSAAMRSPAGPASTVNDATVKPQPAASSGTPVWTAAGPVAVNSLQFGLVTGRVSSVAFDPSDTTGNHAFVGTTGGGLWSSQNAAATNASSVQFLPLTDNLGALSGASQAGISVGAVTVQPGGTGVVLAGLGDPSDALDSYYGAGLLRSTDGGQTWTLIQQTVDRETGLGLQDFSFVGEGFAGFAWSTSNVQLVVAAVSQAYEGTLVNAGLSSSSYEGLYWSNDGGATWHLARITDLNGADVQGPLDGFVLPDGNAATSVVWNPVRQVFIAAVRYHGYYQSADGMNWTQLPLYPAGQPGAGFTAQNCPTQSGSVGVEGCPVFRGSLAVNPTTGDTFAWSVDAFNQDQGIWQDQCNITGFGAAASCGNTSLTFGVQLGTGPLETADGNGPATIENGDYNLSLAAVPSGQDTLLLAGDNDLWKCSLANSCVWRNTTNATTCRSGGVGEYQHGLAWSTGNSLLLFAGTDSGLWRSLDDVGETGSVCAASDASHWQNMNGSLGSLAEVESLGQAAGSAATMLAGMGANGTTGIVGAPAQAGNWNEVLGGEGGTVAVDQTVTANSWYVNNAAGVSIFHCSQAAACTAAQFGTTPVIGEAQVSYDGLSMSYPAAIRLDPVSALQMLIGTCRVWRGPANGSGWSSSNAISPALDGSGSTVCNGNALIRSLAAAPATGGGEVIYAGMAGAADGGGSVAGHVFMASISAGGSVSSWQDLTYSPVTNNGLAFNAFGQDVSGLYADTHDTTGQTVYAAIATFSPVLEPAQRLYRSTDGGAHWTSVTSNLPNAPANAVAVDSQDPNTVYVATDVGVYSTRAIASCGPQTSCWTAYGTGLPLSPVTALVATPQAAVSQVLTAGTYGRGIWQIPTATAGSTLTTYSVSPTTLTFASQAVGTASAAQTVTLKNTGTTALTVSGVSFTGVAGSDFSETDTCVGVALATNGSCALKVTFAPTQTGSRAAQMAIQGNVSGGQALIGLIGTAVAGASVTLLPASLSFGTQQVGTTSASQTVNVQNQGGVTASISTITVTAPFKKVSTTCTSSLAAASACAVVVAFAPTAAGAASGTLTITGALGTQTALLSGTGLLAATDTLSTTSLSFAATTLGQISPPLTVTITNSGGYPLTGIGTSVSSSTGNPDFVTVNNCGSQLAANSSCGITVTFVPSANLAETGTMVISDALRAQPVSLRGTGLRPAVITLSATAVNYGGQQVGVASAAKTFTLTNTGQSTMNQPSFSLSGPGAASFGIGTTTCGATIVSGANCTFQVIFTPVASGATTATLTVSTSTPGVTAIPVTLTGTGLSPPMLGLSPTALNLGTVLLGNSSVPLTVQIANTGQIAMTLPTYAVSGIAGAAGAQLADFAVSAPTDIVACTGPLNPGTNCNVQVTFSPSAAGTESATLIVSASNASPPMATVSLTGTGQAPILLQSNQAALNFPATSVGTTSAAQTVTLSNLSSQSANSLALSVAGPFSIVPALTTCATKLAASSSCTAGLTFTPTASGNQPGTLTATVSNLGVAPLVIPLDGSGSAIGGITVNPTQMAFGSVVLRVASGVQTLTVTNSGAAALTGLAISTTGDFTLTGNQCPASLQAGLSCTTGVGFTPSTTGLRSGTLSVNTSSAGVPPAVVPLTGNGIPAGSMAVNPPVLSFGTVSVGQTSPSQTVTVTNDGATTLAGLTYQLAGDYSLAQNGCGTQLASGALCTVTFTFSPSGPGTRIGSLTIGSTTTGFTPVVVGLTGTGLPTVQLVVTPVQLTFGSVALGNNSAAQQLTVSNPGTGILQGLSFVTTSPFSVGTGSCGSLLLPGGTCQAPVIFTPAVGGSQNGTVTVSTTSLGVAAVRVPVSGSGLAPASLSLLPATTTFPGTATGVASAAQTITVSNPGGGALSGLSVAISGAASGDFAIHSTSCAGTLAAGGSCSIAVVFTPSLTGGRQAVLTASSTTAGVASATAILNGTGLAAAGLSIAPAQLSFATTLVGQATATQVVTVTDSGQAAISNLQLAVTSGFALDPAKTTCTAALSGGASCQAGVVFVPTTGGVITGSITASSALAGGTGTLAVTAPLTGTGALPPGIVASPAALVQFGTTGVGLAAQPAPVKFTNQGGLSSLTGFTLTLSPTATASGFGVSGNTCGPTLAAAASCTVNVTFTPTGYGPLTGTLVAASTNGGTPVTLQLAGIGFDFRLAIAGSNSASVVQGQSANYTLALTALSGSTAASGSKFSFQCDNLPANAICVFNPPQLTVPESNVTGNDALSISTGAPTTGAVSNKDKVWPGTALLLCALLGLPLGWRRRKSRLHAGWLLGLMLAGAICGLSSCAGAGGSTGSGGSGGQSQLGGGTPQGTYNITVTASANNVVHSSTVVLVVN